MMIVKLMDDLVVTFWILMIVKLMDDCEAYGMMIIRKWDMEMPAFLWFPAESDLLNLSRSLS